MVNDYCIRWHRLRRPIILAQALGCALIGSQLLCLGLKQSLAVCVFTSESAGAFRAQKRASDSLGLELQATVSCQTWVLGAELGASGKAAPASNC